MVHRWREARGGRLPTERPKRRCEPPEIERAGRRGIPPIPSRPDSHLRLVGQTCLRVGRPHRGRGGRRWQDPDGRAPPDYRGLHRPKDSSHHQFRCIHRRHRHASHRDDSTGPTDAKLNPLHADGRARPASLRGPRNGLQETEPAADRLRGRFRQERYLHCSEPDRHRPE